MRKYLLKIAIASALLIPLAGNAQEEKVSYGRPAYWRPYDQTGINIFETDKKDVLSEYNGMKLRIGAGFTQQFQNLKHSNKNAEGNLETNKLYSIAPGFMTAQANLFM